MSLRTISFNIASGYLGQFVILASSVATKVLLARLLAPADIGVLLTAQAILGVVTFLVSLGLTDAVIRYVAMNRGAESGAARAAVGATLRLVVPAAVSASVILILIAPRLGSVIAPGGVLFPTVLSILAAYLPFKATADSFGAAFQGAGSYWIKILTIDIGPSLVALCVIASLMMLHQRQVSHIAGAYLVSWVVACAVLVVVAAHRFGAGAAPAGLQNKLVEFGLPLLASGIVAWPMALVPVAIGSLLEPSAVAFYGLAMSLASFIYLGTSVAEAASFGEWSSYVGVERMGLLVNNYRVVTRWGLVFASLVFVPMFFSAPDVVHTVYGPGYEGAARILPLLACAFLLNVVTGPNESILKTLAHTRWIFATRLAVGVSILATFAPLIHRYGLLGAVSSYTISVVVGVTLYASYLFVIHRIHPFDGHFGRTMAAVAIALTGCGLLSQPLKGNLSGATQVVALLTVYAVLLCSCLYLFRAYTERDTHVATRALAQWRRATT